MKRKLLLLLTIALFTQGNLLAQDNCLLYDGASASRVRYNTDTNLDLLNSATDYTIEAWFYPSNNDIHGRVILKRWNQFAITMYRNAEQRVYLTLYNNDGSQKTYINSQLNVVNINQWNHIAIINNSTDNTLKIYMNGVDVTADSAGVSITQTAITLDDAPVSPNFYVGYGGGGTTPYAYIDKVRVKNIAEDIANLNTTDVTVENLTTDANTAVLFNFNEGTGTTTVNEATTTTGTLECRNGCAELPEWFLVNSSMAGVNETNSIAFNIYPNPVTENHFMVQTQNNETLKNIEVTDVLGKVVRSINFDEDTTSFEVSTDNLRKGIYLVKTVTNAGIGTQKLLIE